MSQRERAATRDALIGVARGLVERNGEPALTLGAVADAAGMARATVYGFFSGRGELLRALTPSMPAEEPREAAPSGSSATEATDRFEDGDASAAIWMNYQPDLSEFLPESISLEEDRAEVPPSVPEASVETVEPSPSQARPCRDADADMTEEWIVFEAAAPPILTETRGVEDTEDVATQAEPGAPVAAEGKPAADLPSGTASATPVATVEPTEEVEPIEASTDAVDDPVQCSIGPAQGDNVATAGHAEAAGLEPLERAQLPASAEFDAVPTKATLAELPSPEGDQAGVATEMPPDTVSGPADEELEILAQQDERRRLQAVHLEEIAMRLILPESAIKDGTDAVIARLDTRIRVLEKSIAGLEARQNVAEAEGGRKLRPVSDQVERLHARADGTDARQLQTASELRLSIHRLETRLEALEAPQRGAVSGALSWADPATHFEPQPEPVAPDMPATRSDDAETRQDHPKHNYLSAVRSLAKEGARQAAERETMFEDERQTRRRRMVVAAGVAVLCLCAIGVLFVFRPGSHGISAAQSRPDPAPVHAPARAVLAPLDRLSALAQKGDVSAELLVGLKYLEGGGNDGLAARWLARAADKGNPVAQNALGALYQSGRGVNADLDKATHLYESAAARGNRHAMSNLAVLYAGASGKTKDFAEAARWFQRSASLGYVDAQFNLAVLYERGDGVPQSLLDSYKWYTIAAASGDAVAKTRADAIATQISPDERAAAQRAVAEFKPQPPSRSANEVPSMPGALAAK